LQNNTFLSSPYALKTLKQTLLNEILEKSPLERRLRFDKIPPAFYIM